jgi:hypothetical protein
MESCQEGIWVKVRHYQQQLLDTLDGVYQFDNDYSCEQDCKSTIDELNSC